MASLTVLSPHQDDAALSLAIAIRMWAREGNLVRIINCFTVSSFAPHSKARGTAEVGILRGEEDKAFASHMGDRVQIIDLGMDDAPIRLQCDVGQVRRHKVGQRELADASRIAAAVQEWADGLVLVPLGLGRHIDHLVALEAGLQLANAGRPVAFYEDLPYAAELRKCCVLGAADRASIRSQVGLRAGLARDEEAAQKKVNAVAAYRSQLTESQIQSVIGYGAQLGGAERIWFPSAVQDMFPAPLANAGQGNAGATAAAARRRVQCAIHRAADLARAARRHFAQQTLRGGRVNAQQAN